MQRRADGVIGSGPPPVLTTWPMRGSRNRNNGPVISCGTIAMITSMVNAF